MSTFLVMHAILKTGNLFANVDADDVADLDVRADVG